MQMASTKVIQLEWITAAETQRERERKRERERERERERDGVWFVIFHPINSAFCG